MIKRKVKNPVSQNIRIFPKIKKKKIFKTEKFKYVNFCTQYLVGAPSAQVPASVWCGIEAIGLWFC